MKDIRLTVPELALVAGTRAALGVGVGLLAANYLSEDQRRSVGWTLVAFGALCTIPLAFEILGGQRPLSDPISPEFPGEEWRSAPPNRPVRRNATAPYYADELK
jgi:hypothetical protein